MFYNQGKTRNYRHNLSLATILCFVAGIVNVSGFLAVQKLTTNVTGHFAFFMEEVIEFDFREAIILFLFVGFYFLGSFCSSLLMEVISRKNTNYTYSIPVLIECMILFSIAIANDLLISGHPNIIAFSLLFAMGLQNALVTKISNSVVRTTHLTGLFTDLGIELSQLFFYKTKTQKLKLQSSIRLKLTIISFFFLGGVVAGLIYPFIGLNTLIIASFLLIFGGIYDYIKRIMLKLTAKITRLDLK